MSIRTKTLNRLKSGNLVAAEIKSTNSRRRAWIGVYPLDSSMQPQFRIRKFEVDKRYLVNDNDVWEGTMEAKEDYYAKDVNELKLIISNIMAEPKELGNPWDCEYPI